MRTWLGLVLAVALLLSLCGCGAAAVSEGPRDKSGSEDSLQMFEQLRELGIYPMSAWTEGNTLYMTVLRPNQQTVDIIRELADGDVVVIEEKEYFFNRGQITEIETGTNSLGRILIENGDAESQCDKAYISVADYTMILRTITQLGQEVDEALTFDQLDIGQTVEVWVVGAVAESYPPQAGAGKIQITE